MKNKGFTLIELLLVIVIIAIITVIAVPGIMEALAKNKEKSGESVEKLLLKNLELYNSDKEEDLWCLEGEEYVSCPNPPSCLKISIDKLFKMNPDINMGECLLKDSDSLFIEKLENGNYKFYAKIVCGKDLESKTGEPYVWKSGSGSLYYETPDLSLDTSECA